MKRDRLPQRFSPNSPSKKLIAGEFLTQFDCQVHTANSLGTLWQIHGGWKIVPNVQFIRSPDVKAAFFVKNKETVVRRDEDFSPLSKPDSKHRRRASDLYNLGCFFLLQE